MRGLPAWLAPAGLLVCLLNPHGLKVFALPPELSLGLAGTGLTEDVRFRSAFLSPWQVGVHFWPVERIDLAEWAYFILLALGIVSFCLEGRQTRVSRLAVWLIFALLVPQCNRQPGAAQPVDRDAVEQAMRPRCARLPAEMHAISAECGGKPDQLFGSLLF